MEFNLNSRWNNTPKEEKEINSVIKSVVVNITGDVGTPSGTATFNNGVLTITLDNIKGTAFNDEGKIEYPNGTLEWIE